MHFFRSFFLSLLLCGCAPAFITPTPSTQATVAPTSNTTQASQPPFLQQVVTYELPYRPSVFAFEPNGTTWLSCGGNLLAIALDGQPVRQTSIASATASQLIVDAHGFWLNDNCCAVVRYGRDGAWLQSYAVGNTDWTSVPFNLDVDGNLWVSYNFADKAYKYSPNGTRLLDLDHLGARAYFNDSQGNVKVCGASAITTLKRDGTVLSSVPTGGNIYQCAIDSHDNIWAYEQGSQSILKIDATKATAVRHVDGSLGNLQVKSDNTIWYTDGTGTLYEMSSTGDVLDSQSIGTPYFALDPLGRIWAGYEVKQSESVYTGKAVVYKSSRSN
jgi:streptogramin lyase